MAKIKVSSNFAIPKDLQVKTKKTKALRSKMNDNAKYPFAIMKVGESFTVSSKVDRSNAISAASHFSTRNGNRAKFASRSTKGNKYRVFRIS